MSCIEQAKKLINDYITATERKIEEFEASDHSPFELHPYVNPFSIRCKLSKAFTELNNGAYSAVYDMEDGTVLKFGFDMDDDNYQNFVEFIQAAEDDDIKQHLPEIIEFEAWPEYSCFYVIMPMYTEINSYTEGHRQYLELIEVVQEVYSPYQKTALGLKWDIIRTCRWGDFSKDERKEYLQRLKQHQSLFKLVWELIQYDNSTPYALTADFHDGNFMLSEDGTLLITDPWC